jgi:sensor histidine kinase regulating citrate/malate metabolism
MWTGRKILPVVDAGGAVIGRVSVGSILEHGRPLP